MSWRIEHADPLTVLTDLPDGLVQTCVTSPPGGDAGYTLAVLGEVHRVLRHDGTLWLPARGCPPQLTRALTQAGWLQPFAAPAGRGLMLFTKQPDRVLFDPARGGTLGAGDPRAALTRPADGQRRSSIRRRAWCIPAPGTADWLSSETVRWCIATATVPLACGVCGAPYQHAPEGGRSGRRWRASCAHLDDRGRCLVLDPFCSTPVAVAAVRRGRAFLGITEDPTVTLAMRRQLARVKARCAR